MKEDFLHYVWKYQKFHSSICTSTSGELVEIEQVGHHNKQEGPDFFNARIRIDGQLWAGNVEIHVRSSDWYAHHHEQDQNYDSVILHVVWEHDVSIFRTDQSVISTLEINRLVSHTAVKNYQALCDSNHQWIPCERHLNTVIPFIRSNWLTRLYIERLEKKSELMLRTLSENNFNWDALLFVMLCKNFGLQYNGDSFYSIATSIDYSIFRKCAKNAFDLECLLFGLAGLLETDQPDVFQEKMQHHFAWLKHKYQFAAHEVVSVKFFRLRPPNFPTIRLSQFAQLIASNDRLFSKIVHAPTHKELVQLFQVSASSHWNNHYNFGTPSRVFQKKTTLSFINLILINTIIPIIFCYRKYQGISVSEEIIQLAELLPAEKNGIVHNFAKLDLKATNSLDSQGLLELYHAYCSKSKCLQCAIGNWMLKRS